MTRTAIKAILRDLVDLVYPRICAACDSNSPVLGQIFCVDCLVELPQTNYHRMNDNPFERHFWGRVDIRAGAACYFFIPGGRTQTLLHNIKYRRRRDLAEEVGRIYGKMLGTSQSFSDCDLVLPVPLHWRKKRQRGFNQSEAFGKGLASGLGIELEASNMVRILHTSTQTSKTREERVANMRNAFSLRSETAIANKHILLVDDVLTTGATLEACANVLKKAPGVTVSMVTIACGRI